MFLVRLDLAKIGHVGGTLSTKPNRTARAVCALNRLYSLLAGPIRQSVIISVNVAERHPRDTQNHFWTIFVPDLSENAASRRGV